jgi:hypothetical protein
MESDRIAVFCRVAPSRGLIPAQLQLLGQSLQDWMGRHGFPNTGMFACLAGLNDLLDGEYPNIFSVRLLKCYRFVSALFGQEPITNMPIDEGARLIVRQWGVHPNSHEAFAIFEHDDPAAIEADFRRSIDRGLGERRRLRISLNLEFSQHRIYQYLRICGSVRASCRQRPGHTCPKQHAQSLLGEAGPLDPRKR